MNKPVHHDRSLSLSQPPTKQTETIASIGLLNNTDLATLADNGIDSLDDLADLASEELLDIVGAANMTRDVADQVIMAARAHWFEATD